MTSANTRFRLLIDAGNSRIKWALVRDDDSRAAIGAFTHQGPANATLTHAHAESHASQWDTLPRPSDVWISNVAGTQTATHIDTLIDAHWSNVTRTTIVSQRAQCGVTNLYCTPKQLGTDRWAGMIGAHAAYPGEHLLIVTLGTATTIEALHADGTFFGGLIAPGWSLMMYSLSQHTARLPALTPTNARSVLHVDRPLTNPGKPAVKVNPDTPPTDTLRISFGTDTPASLSAGCVLAQTGLIEHAYRTWRDELNGAPVRLLLSGGAAHEVCAALTVPYTRHDHLVLSGLAIIARAACDT